MSFRERQTWVQSVVFQGKKNLYPLISQSSKGSDETTGLAASGGWNHVSAPLTLHPQLFLPDPWSITDCMHSPGAASFYCQTTNWNRETEITALHCLQLFETFFWSGTEDTAGEGGTWGRWMLGVTVEKKAPRKATIAAARGTTVKKLEKEKRNPKKIFSLCQTPLCECWHVWMLWVFGLPIHRIVERSAQYLLKPVWPS